MTSLSAALLFDRVGRETSKPATRVFYRLPTWLTEALNDAYEPEVLNHFGRRLRNLCDADGFLRVLQDRCDCKPFDHCGSDADGNFVSEPYARNCSACLNAAKEFARRLGVRLTVSAPTFHAPGIEKCVRFTFCKPGGAR